MIRESGSVKFRWAFGDGLERRPIEMISAWHSALDATAVRGKIRQFRLKKGSSLIYGFVTLR
jgi:hypothetical protein